MDAWDPVRKKYVKVSGEKTIGTSPPPHAVKPRLLGEEVRKFKLAMGVCLADGCAQIAGHDGECT